MTFNPSKIIVTGAAGLIGGQVSRKLLSLGKKVIAVDLKADSSLTDVEWITGDITNSEIITQLKSSDAQALIHCAAHPGGKSLQEPSENVRINAYGSMRLFEMAALAKMTVIFLSSSIVYGETSARPIVETDPVKPMTVYGACKIACENFLKILGEGYGLQWTVLRLFATYGPGHKPNPYQGIVNVMLTQLLQGNHIVVKGSLGRVRDLIYIDDTADAIVASLFAENARGLTMNVGTGAEITIATMIEELIAVMAKDRKTITIEEQAGTVGDPIYNIADITLLKEMTGFTPQYDLTSGLQQYLQKIHLH